MTDAGTSPLRIKWGKVEVISPGVLDEGGFSATTGADVPGETAFPLSVLLDTAQVALRVQPPQVAEPLDQSLCATWTGAIRVPVELKCERSDLSFRSYLRFFVNKDEGARALLIANLGGGTVMRDFGYGQKLDAEDMTLSTFHELSVRPISAYVASFLLLVERHNLENGADLRIDSLDVEMSP